MSKKYGKKTLKKIKRSIQKAYRKTKPVIQRGYRGGVTTAKGVARDIRDIRRAGSLGKKKKKKKRFISAEEFNRRLLGA